MFIQTEATDDPDTARFWPHERFSTEGTKLYPDAASAENAPLALRLFAIAGVAAVEIDPGYVAVTKADGEWRYLNPLIFGAITNHFASGEAAVIAQPLSPLERDVRTALRTVIDPELGYNIVDLGLVYAVTASEDGAVAITMTTTSPGCPATAFLTEGARSAAASVDGSREVAVTLSYQPRWSPDKMAPVAKAHFGVR